jgi:DNA helicase-2/ATP-dependent DNA helicase PcrA
MSEDKKILITKEQQTAIETNQGPLLIIAGAGSGKTTVIVKKIEYLLQNKVAQPEEILALTFTEKAACEMEERLDQILPYGFYNLTISTFHAFADQILKEKGSEIGLPINFKLMTEAEVILFFKKNLFLFNLDYYRPIGNPNKFIQAIIDHFYRLRDEDVSEKEYQQFVKTNPNLSDEERKKYHELAFAYEQYQKLKIKEGYLDFADLIHYLLLLFRQRKNILQEYQNRFRYILVDEFQDTNFAQYQLIKLLAPAKNNPNLTVVGDDNQSIYKFRGASIANILNFFKDYPKANIVTLLKNFRSNQTILDTAYRLIKNNDPETLEARLKISKKLIAQKSDNQSAVNFYWGENINQECEFVAKKIESLTKENYRYCDIALLVRANNHAQPFINTFIRRGIPYQFLGPGILFKQPEVKDLIAYLKFLYDIQDSVSLFRILSMEVFSLNNKDLHLLISFSRQINQPLFQTIEIYLSFFQPSLAQPEYEIYKKYLPLLKKETGEKLWQIYQILTRHLALMKKKSATALLYYFLEDSGYLQKLIAPKTEKEEKITLNITKFFERIKEYENTHEDNSITAVVEFLEMSMELGESPFISRNDIENLNAVNILTVHSAKGLEFPVVFLVNLVNGRFPTREKKETILIPQELIKELLPSGDYHLQEERRLFYVGLTRAKDSVFLTAARFYGEGKRQTKISPFVIESLEKETLEKIINKEKEAKKQLSIFDFQPKEEKIITVSNLKKNFSFSQINVYQTCPLQYRYQYILNLPTAPQASASFGNTIHATLCQFYQEFKKNKEVDKSILLSLYEKNWIPVGYLSSTQEKKIKKEGEKILTDYLKKFHHKNLKIISLERPFKIKLKENIIITGKIDRVDIDKEGNIEIIDYKTGAMPDEKKLKNDLQLSIYALAVLSDPTLKTKLDKIILSYLYLQQSQKISFKKSLAEIEKTKESILDTVNQINQQKFLPKVGPWCDFCPFKIICEAWQ